MDKKPTHRNTSCGNLRRPHRTKTSTVWCCLLLRVAAFLASAYTGRPCTSFVVERVPPQGAPYMGAQRYQADAVEDPSSDEEPSTTDGEDTSEDDDSVDPKWCPPNPNAQDDPAEEELIGAAEKLDTMMMARVQPPSNIFFTPENLGALPALWLQAKLTISLAPFQEKFAKLFQTIAVELWLRGRSNDIRRW